MANFIEQNIGGLLNRNSRNHNVTDNTMQSLMQAKQKAEQAHLSSQYDASKSMPPQDDFKPSAKGLQAAALGSRLEQSYAYSQTMSLSLTTKEGDEVTLDFRQLYAQYEAQQQTQYAEQGPKGARYFESRSEMEATAFEERFGFSVEGHLNENELDAVFSVFEQVDQLANEFYNGDLEKALEKAQELNIDFGQLSSVNVGLSKTEVQTSAYQQVAAYQGAKPGVHSEDEAQGQHAQDIKHLPPYLQQWQTAITTLDAYFEESRSTFDNWMADGLSQRFPEGSPSSWFERVASFHDQLAEVAKLDKQTLQPSGVELDVGETTQSDSLNEA